MRNQTVLVVLGGLGFLLGTGFLMADDAPRAPTSLQEWNQADHRRMGWNCFNERKPVTWAAFDTELRPMKLIRGAELLECLDYGDDGLLDLDGDGTAEHLTEDEAGIRYSGSTVEATVPIMALRHDEDGLGVEVIMNFDDDLTYWLSQLDLESMSEDATLSLYSKGYFDVDNDGMFDAIFRMSYLDFSSGEQIFRFFWYRNQLTPPTRSGDSDLNDDGRVDGEDLLQLLSDWSG